MDAGIELIRDADGHLLCYVIRRTVTPPRTTFITDPDARQQLGFVVYPAGSLIQRHRHRQLERSLVGMSELLLVRTGKCRLDLYDDAGELVVSRVLEAGDAVLLIAGGHGFELLEDTVFLEIKQGPYLGEDDKELF